MLKIWGRTTSINVQKVMWAVGELGLPHERIDAGLAHGLVNEPWYRAMNPNGRVPVIDDEGFVLWESNAIVRYLARGHGSGTLCPADPQVCAAADRWMDWASTTVHPIMTPLFWGLIRTPADKRDMAAIESDRLKMEEAMVMLDAHLRRQPYVAGDAFSMGDIPLGCFAFRWRALPIVRGSHPHLEAWAARLEARPAYRANVMLPLS